MVQGFFGLDHVAILVLVKGIEHVQDLDPEVATIQHAGKRNTKLTATAPELRSGFRIIWRFIFRLSTKGGGAHRTFEDETSNLPASYPAFVSIVTGCQQEIEGNSRRWNQFMC